MTQTVKRTPSDLIRLAAFQVVSGALAVERAPGFCLKLTRQVVEYALKLGDGGFYRRFVAVKVDPKHEGFWARDAQKSLRQLGWGVRLDSLKGGEIVCNHRVSKPYGHIGVYVGTVTLPPTGNRPARTLTDMVLENTDSRRGIRLGGAVALTPLAEFDPDEAFRVPDAFSNTATRL